MKKFGFRVWNTKTKEYVDPNKVSIDGHGNVTFNGNKVQHLVIEYWTGLTDTKKIKLFKNDIVMSGGIKYIVRWSSRMARFNLEILYDSEAEGLRETHKDIPIDAFLLTIISNIHKTL